ncbi:cryptochrome/photolyase family protein [Nocardia miyunensis]|uniref:cryptochrome/photolyase family protein n=1 Tax=Nocardia miyunensis TaxID=282684 RepID=UPI0008326713|nr:deoxyribodipyrimidine photo-lyase [Nocardia miyunensis]
MTVTIALFTRDLRVHDNPMLRAAVREGAAVVPLFVLDNRIIEREPVSPNRIRFLLTALSELDDELHALGGRLIVRRGDILDEVDRVVTRTHAESVHIAADVSWYSRVRERRLRERLAHRDCLLHTHDGSLTVATPGDPAPATGRGHFAVFTPYFRRWMGTPVRRPLAPPPRFVMPPIRGLALPRPDELCAEPGSPQMSAGGETSGRKLMRQWLSGPIRRYDSTSDHLAADATSHLSPYLHFGCVSATELVHRADTSTPGGHAFVRQLAWRDFHHQLLADRPEAGWTDYRRGPVGWREDPDAAEAWRSGRTGYPVIDAAMRQLVTEGWMPGRARLIVAAFLTKTLRIDWRIGAAHFQRWLVDGDVANNQLNWQWAAGTGTDTRPNRVLNPLRQAERHDPDGEYVRRWLPELADLSGASAHTPWRSGVPHSVYPAPIVEVKGM